jgi:hypothetical protein
MGQVSVQGKSSEAIVSAILVLTDPTRSPGPKGLRGLNAAEWKKFPDLYDFAEGLG